jgi:hypothetical protein
VVLGVAVIGVAVYAFMVMGERNNLQETLDSTQQELMTTKATLASTETELATTKDTLSSTQADLSSTRDTLTDTQDTLTDTQDELAATEDELSATEDELGAVQLQLYSTEDELDHIQAELNDTEEELDNMTALYQVAYETLRGLDITLAWSPTCYDVRLVDNPEATNPTWAELKAFLAQDQTEHHDYILNEYDCSQFSRDLHNRAEAAGIRCAEVHIDFVGESTSHALNAFLTADYGLVYVDCTEAPDKIARVKSGYAFRAVNVSFVSITNIRNDSWWNSQWTYYYIPSSNGGQARVENIMIFW